MISLYFGLAGYEKRRRSTGTYYAMDTDDNISDGYKSLKIQH